MNYDGFSSLESLSDNKKNMLMFSSETLLGTLNAMHTLINNLGAQINFYSESDIQFLFSYDEKIENIIQETKKLQKYTIDGLCYTIDDDGKYTFYDENEEEDEEETDEEEIEDDDEEDLDEN